MDKDRERLGQIIAQRHERALADLLDARRVIGHPTEKGSVTEQIWLDLFRRYLPHRYQVRRAIVVDHLGQMSDQIDLVVHDALYTPFILEFGGFEIVPVESVYAVFEVKQAIDRANLRYAEAKVASVLRLIRAIRQTEQVKSCQETKILTGLLGSSAQWITDTNYRVNEYRSDPESLKNIDYVVSAQSFVNFTDGNVIVHDTGRAPISRFLLRFVAHLQAIGTVMPIDIERYLIALD
jgi:hypothetical protein